MAQLPASIDVGTAVGMRPSGAAPAPTDYGLGDAADALASFGKAKAAADQRVAGQLLQTAQQTYEPQFQERAAAYDGSQSGWAAAETGKFDEHFQPVLNQDGLSNGVRFALQQLTDSYKTKVAQQAIGVESQKRAGIIEDQEKVKSAQAVETGFNVFQKSFGTAQQQRYDNYDGSERNYVAGISADLDQTMQAAVEATPEMERPALQLRLLAQRQVEIAKAMQVEDHGHTAYVADQVKKNSRTTINGVMSNPAGYSIANANADALFAGVPAETRRPLIEDYRSGLASARIAGLIARNDFAGAQSELQSGTYDAVLQPGAKEQLLEAVKARSAKRASDLLGAAVFGADVDPAQVAASAHVSGNPELIAQAQFYAATGAATPQALADLSKGQQPGGFADLNAWVMHDLEGGAALVANDNGHGATKFGVNQAAHPEVDVPNLTEAGATQLFRTRYWKALGAEQLPPPLRAAAFSAAVNMGVETTRQMLAQSGYDPGRFMSLQEQRYRTLAAQPGQAGNLPVWMDRMAKERAKVGYLQAFMNAQDGVSSDPIKYAMGDNSHTPLATVAALPDVGAPGWAQALQSRVQVGQMMNQTYRAPLRLLTNGEAADYKDAISRDPTEALKFAQAAKDAIGPQATLALLGELGQQGEAGVELHLADLSARGLTTFAENATRGLALKKAGAKLDTAYQRDLTTAVQNHAPLFAGQEATRLGVSATAEAAMLYDAQSGPPKPASYYVNGALGANTRNGAVFGGVARVNGQDTIVPSWLAAERASDALEQLAGGWEHGKTGPVYTNGAAIPADQIRRMRMQLLANGRYILQDAHGAAPLGRDGRPFTFDLDKARGGLRSLLGAQAVAADH